MCDEGRFGFKYVHIPIALQPLPAAKVLNGRPANDWSAILPAFKTRCRDAAKRRPGRLGGRTLSVDDVRRGVLAGEVSEVAFHASATGDGTGADRRRGRPLSQAESTVSPLEPTKFTIRAEKCPNRAGVAEILKHFEGKVVSFDDLKSQIAGGQDRQPVRRRRRSRALG